MKKTFQLRAKSIVLFCLLQVTSCNPQPSPRPPTQPDADAAPAPGPSWPDASRDAFVPKAGTTCEQSCDVLRWIGCVEGEPTPNGQPCESVCTSFMAFPGLGINPSAIALCRDVDCVRRNRVRCLP